MNKYIYSALLAGVICFMTYGFINPTGEFKVLTEKNNDPVVGLNMGNKAPELNFNDPNGKPIALSSLKGKVVLIDFWASWCRPCRAENPNVVRVYNEYKDKKFINGKGFTVYGVSLDQKRDSWQAAILQDQLNWPSHVSDLKGWYSAAAKTYRVSGIPANVLIDGDGIIVGRNLRGPALGNALEKLAVK